MPVEKYFIENNLTELQEMTSMLNGSVHNLSSMHLILPPQECMKKHPKLCISIVEGRTDVYLWQLIC
jgi:hypothetical protein